MTARPGLDVANEIRSIIAEAFLQPLEEYKTEIRQAALESRIAFAPLRPVFVLGTPEEAVVRRYILFLGLNPKLDKKRTGNTAHYAKINASPNDNATVTLDYFTSVQKLHSYFNKRAHVVRSFAECLGVRQLDNNRDLLRRFAIFCEFVPYHSEKTDGDLRKLTKLTNVVRAKRVLSALIATYPPAAILLDGKQTEQCLNSEGPREEYTLSAVTKCGPCRVARFTYTGIPVTHCRFIGSRGGVNSVEQRVELGRLLAGVQ